MAVQYGKLVNKQFNSPIKLYSENNIREVLDRESQMLSNGAVGINFHNPTVNKPANLQHSAVLRFLEEEEQRKRGGSPSLKRVAWPPPPEGEGHLEEVPVQDLGGSQISSSGLQNTQVPSANYHQPRSNYQQEPEYNYQQYPELANQHQTITTSPHKTPTSPSYQKSPVSPLSNVTSPRFTQHAKPWAPVQSPSVVASQPNYTQQYPPLNQYSTEQYQNPSNQYEYPHQQPVVSQFQQPTVQSQQQHQNHDPYQQRQTATQPRAHYTAPPVEPPPSTITLRPQAPVSQAPAPVYTSQPATATLKGGKNLRGDLKWPPPETKAQMEEENRKRIELARGPVCRPRKVNRDYSSFFAQNALNNTYPGYKIPPGTQFYARD